MERFNRNQIAHLVVWPVHKTSSMELIDTDGVSQSELRVTEVLTGHQLAKTLPEGCLIEFKECFVANMKGETIMGGKGEFNTIVVRERPEITFEQRMQRLERQERNRAVREAKRQADLERATEELAALRAEQAAQDVLDPQDPPEDPQDPPAAPLEPHDTVEGGET